jgi:hypothetical protein
MRRPSFLRAASALALAAALGASAPLAGCSKPTTTADAGAPEALPPVPAPAGLLADVVLSTPDATWSKARAALGGPAMLMPASTGALVATLLGLPITVAGEIDGGVPIVGALVDASGQEPHAAIGVHVKAGDRFVDQLTKPAEARFTARPDAASHMTFLDPKGAGPRAPGVLAVLGNYLLVAPTAADLTNVGPYVARTLPTKTAPKEELAVDADGPALAGPVLAAARSLTADAARLPLGGMVQSALDVLADAQHARLTAGLDPAGLHVRVAVTPKPGGATAKLASELTAGDPRRLFELPADSLAGFLFYQSPAARAESAAAQAEGLGRLLDTKLGPADKEAVAGALRELGEARGDWLVGGLTFAQTGPAGFARGAVLDADKLDKGAKALIGLAKSGPVKALLKDMDLGVSTGTAKVDGVGPTAQRVRLERLSKAKKGGPDMPTSIDLLYAVDKDALVVATGFDAKAALASVASAPKKDNLGGVPDMKAAIEGLGPEVAFAVLFDPVRIGAVQTGRPAAAPGPIAVAGGRAPGGGELWLRVDVATEAVREIVRRRAGGR